MGEWKKVKLGDYLVEHTEKTTRNNQYPVLTSSREGIFLQTDYYNRVIASKDNTVITLYRTGISHIGT